MPGRLRPGDRELADWRTDVHIDPEALHASVKRLRDIPLEHGVRSALQHVCLAAVGLFGVRGAGVMMIDDAAVLRYVAASDEPGRRLERAQEQTGEGPCVDTLVLDQIVSTVDLATDPRWPRLSELLADGPIRAVLGVPAHAGGGAIGSLNLYHDVPHEWDATEIEALRAFNGIVESLLGAALLAEARETVVEQLRYALDHRVTIERAIGVIMGRDRTDAVTAFNVLRERARSQRRTVADLAGEILAGFAKPPAAGAERLAR
jgi:GAF domain-containing protein